MTFCLAVVSIGCRHDARLITNGDRPRVVQDIRYAEGVAFDLSNQRRVYVRYEDDDVSEVTDGDSVYLFLSFRLKRNRQVDWRDPRVYLVWQGASVSFAGFLSDEALQADTARGSQEFSGRFKGTVSTENVSVRRNIDLKVSETTVDVVKPEQGRDRDLVKIVDQILAARGADRILDAADSDARSPVEPGRDP